MSSPEQSSHEHAVTVYEAVAHKYHQQGETPMRDRFLVLAADAALSGGAPAEAERVRTRLLEVNPHHILKPFSTFPEAMRSPDLLSYVNGLRRSYPVERAEQILAGFQGSAAADMPVLPDNPPLAPDPRPAAVRDSWSPGDRGRRSSAPPPPVPPPVAPPPHPAPRPVVTVGESLAFDVPTAHKVAEPSAAGDSASAEPHVYRLREQGKAAREKPVPVAAIVEEPTRTTTERSNVRTRRRGSTYETAAAGAGGGADEADSPATVWVTWGVFLILLALELAVAGYAVLGPFVRP